MAARIRDGLAASGSYVDMMLDSFRLHLAETLFERLVRLPAGSRASALEEACAQDREMRDYVERLLRHDDSGMGGFLESPLIEASLSIGAEGPATLPHSIGGYRVLRRLGEGGMGVVYEGEQPHTRRRVALKAIRDIAMNERSIRRFHMEAEALARLRHPGIASIFEFNVGDICFDHAPPRRQPYFAMELVEGEPICAFADRRKFGLRERLELIAAVCDAVHHAHQKGVIHRDLKPGNILVEENGQPRVLDFGVARVVDVPIETRTAHTAVGQLLGTIAYMSPEQLNGDAAAVDTRSDVYALGVVAYELLTGTVPIDITGQPLPLAIRMLAETEPKLAGAVRPALRGDVEAILAKALARALAGRYASAAELGGDIRRYLSHEPVIARAPGALYQLSKFARRHRGLVVGAAVALLALVAGTIGTAGYAWKARRSAERADEQAARAQATVKLLRKMLASVDPRAALGREVTVREMLDDAARRLADGELNDQPEAKAALQSTIGETYLQLGRYADAKPHLVAALATFESIRGHQHPDVMANESLLAAVLMGLGEFDEAERLARDALALAEALYGKSHRQVAGSLCDLGLALASHEKLSEAEVCYRRALDMRRALANVPSEEMAESLNNLGTILLRLGRLDEAEPLLRESLALRRAALHPDHPNLVGVLNNLGSLLKQRGKLDDAERMLAEALDIRRRALDPKHSDLATSLNNLAGILIERGRPAEAIPLYREVIDIQRVAAGGSPDLGKTLINLAGALSAAGERSDAEREARSAVDQLRVAFGENDPNVAAAMHNLACMFRDAGDLSAAERMMRDALAIFEKRLPAGHPTIAHCRDSLGTFLILMRRPAEAVPLLADALELRRAAFGNEHYKVALTLTNLAVAKLALDELPEAARIASEAVDVFRKLNETSADAGVALLTLAEARLGMGAADSADSEIDSLVKESREIRVREFGASSWQTADADRVRGLHLVRKGVFAEAETLLSGAYKSLEGEDTPAQFQRGQARRRTIQAMSALYTAWGKPEDAATWQALMQRPAGERVP